MTATAFTPPTPVLTNSATNYIFDSTASFLATPGSSVGSHRGRHPNTRIQGVVSCATQDVTVRMDVYNAVGAAWVTGFASQTVTAGTDQPIDWLSPGCDWRVVEVNGGAGPSALTFYGFTLVKGDRASGA